MWVYVICRLVEHHRTTCMKMYLVAYVRTHVWRHVSCMCEDGRVLVCGCVKLYPAAWRDMGYQCGCSGMCTFKLHLESHVNAGMCPLCL